MCLALLGLSLVPPGLFIAGLSNIAFVVAAALRFRAGAFGSATVAALIAVSFMIFCGVTSSGGGEILGPYPGGRLGPGYYLWMLSGVLSVYSAIGALVNARGLTAKREVYWR
jgi:hypothetical protein